MKKRYIMLMLSLLISIPSISFADSNMNVLSNKRLINNILLDKNEYLEKQEIPEETKVKVKEAKEKLKNGEINKEQFHKEMKNLFPGKTHQKKKGSFKDLPEETKTRLKDLKKQLIDGEITEDQFHEELDKIMPKREMPKRINPKKFKNESIDKEEE